MAPYRARLRYYHCDTQYHAISFKGDKHCPKSPQKNSRRLELLISKNTPHGRWGQGPGSVDPRFPAGLPFPVPEILEFVAFFAIRENFSSDFPGTFLQNSCTDPGNSHSLLEFSERRCDPPPPPPHRAITVLHFIKTSPKYFRDTLATSMAHHEKYHCWASKTIGWVICVGWSAPSARSGMTCDSNPGSLITI